MHISKFRFNIRVLLHYSIIVPKDPMRAKRNFLKSLVSRLLIALLLTAGIQSGLGAVNDAAHAAATLVTDDGSNSSGWTNNVTVVANAGNPGSAFGFSKNDLMGHPFGTSANDFSGATIQFDAKFTNVQDHIAVFWGRGISGVFGTANGLYIGPAGNAGTISALSGKIGLQMNASGPQIYWNGVDGGVTGTGSASVTSGDWVVDRWYTIKVVISSSTTSYYVDNTLIQTKATSIPTSNYVTIGGDDRNGWGFTNGVFVDNISLQPAIPPKVITYNYNGATGANAALTDNFTDAAVTLPIPTKTNFTFEGWFESVTFTGSAIGTTYSPTASVTLNAKWSKTQYSMTFDSGRGTPLANSSFTFTDAVQRPSDPTRNGYRFKGWSASLSGQLLNFPYLPSAMVNTTIYAQWEQKSLVGIDTAQLVNPSVISPNGNDQTLISTRAASGNVARTRTTINYYDGALPSSYDISVYTLSDNTFASEQLGSDKSYIISQVVTWKDRVNGDVTDTVVRKEIEMTIESTEIKSGAKVYAIVDGVSTLLATATTDGSVTVKFATDPVIVVAAAPAAPTSPPSSGGAGGTSPTPTPSPLPVISFAKSFNILGFNPGSWSLTKSIKKSIDAFFKSITKPNKISCVGYTSGPTVLSVDAKLAVRRGQEVCRYIGAKNPTIAHVITKGTTTRISSDYYRRTKVTVSN